MAYTDVVLLDSPDFYVHLDDTTVGATTVNAGTRGGTATVNSPSSIVGGQTASPNIGGTSWKFGTGYLGYTHPTVTATQLHSFETWIKRDIGNTTASAEASLFYWNGSSRKAEFLITPSTGVWRVMMGSTSLTQRITGTNTALADGNWHHIAYTYDATTIRVYIDGALSASVASALGNTNTTGSINIGPRGGNDLGAFLDESTFYLAKTLAADRILAHYNAGSAPAGISVSTAVPAASISLATVAPVFKNNTPKIVTAPAFTVSLSAPAPVVTAVNAYRSVLSIAADRGQSTYGGSLSIPFGGTEQSLAVLIKFASVSVPAGQRVKSATLRVYIEAPASTSAPLTIRSVSNTWSETIYSNAILGSNPTAGPTITTSGWYNIDVTPFVNTSGFAVSLVAPAAGNGGTGYLAYYARESGNAPSLIIQREDIPAVNATSVVTGPASLSVTTPAAVITTVDSRKSYAVIPSAMTVNIAAPSNARIRVDAFGRATNAASLSVEMRPASVTTTKSPRIQVFATTLTLQAPGGQPKLPDKRITPPAFEAWFFTPNAKGYIEVPSVNKVEGAMSISLVGTSGASINLQTDRTVYVTNTMRMTTRMVGIYSAEDDRYNAIIPTTVGTDDVWLPLNETTGTIAHDVMGVGETGDGREVINGTLVGGPVLNVSGPELRPAMRFDGTDDWINMGEYSPRSTFGSMDLTIELSLKTTDLNGTLITGGATTQTSASAGNTLGNRYSYSEISLVNGQLVISNGTTKWVIRKNIADDKWHHIIISVPAANSGADTSFNFSAGDSAFVSIDGVTVWKRYEVELDGRYLLPDAIMARAGNWYGTPSNFLSGELSNLVFRLNYAVSESTAQKIYYEWSNTTVTHAEPMSLSLQTVDPFKAAGNTKKMLALYGLPYGLQRVGDSQTGYSRDGWGNYYSVFAGFYIKNTAGISNLDGDISYSGNLNRMRYHTVKPFTLEGYMVYPMAIMKQPGSNGGPFSAAGIENGEYIDPSTGLYIDDITGLPRFADVDKDLIGNIEDYDALTVVNYPGVRPDDGPENVGVSADVLREPRQHNMGLTNSQWSAARDALGRTILDASYRGVNLWITEAPMAEHLGFIKGWDKHDTAARVEFYGPGNIDATGYTNTYAHTLDLQHIRPGAATGGLVRPPAKTIGQFNFTWQANAKRRIVNLENGLTDMSSWEMVDRISWDDDDDFRPYAVWMAWDVADRTSGLHVGDEIVMEMWEQNATIGYPVDQTWSLGDPRKFIISARPDGIVGKVISREMEVYHGPNGVTRVNPYRNNAYTIAAEVGSVVKGRPIAGRVFIELMDTQTLNPKIAIDRKPGMWMGQENQDVTSWSFDSRRYKENVAVVVTETNLKRTRPNGDVSIVPITWESRYAEIQTPELDFKPFASMNARGLNWLQQKSTVPAGTARAFVPAMEISLSGADVKVTKTRNLNIPVTGAAHIYLEARRPHNFQDGNIEETAIPMVITLEMRGIGKSVKTDPIVLDLGTPNARVIGQGDRIYVYMDANRYVTLYMKED